MTKRNRGGNTITTSSAQKYIIGCITVAITVTAYFFWAFPYRAALSYREQLQLFQTTGQYFSQLTHRPGGLATYAGEFLTQFFNNFYIGAAVMAILLITFLLTIYSLNLRLNQQASKGNCFTIAALPFIALWLYLGNADVTVAFITALTATSAGALLYEVCINRPTSPAGYTLMIVGTTLLYWAAGPATLVFTMLIITYCCKKHTSSAGSKAAFAILSLACIAANIAIWSGVVAYPLSYQLIGIGYNMHPDNLNAGQVIVEALCIFAPVLAAFLARFPGKFTIPALSAVMIGGIVILFPKAYDKTAYRLMEYDFLVRANNWEGILRLSDTHSPDLPLSVSATNLALGMTGQLDSRAFAYFQHGTEGLVPPFVKETLSSWTTGEIFFQLGMINSAQRFYFEGMEAIPNYNKSSRAIRRLAETAMIRGDYALAEKYLHMLENTLFYRKWARRNLDLLKDPDGVDGHPLYGRLRTRMLNDEYLFSEGELDKTFGQLFLRDADNNLAKQYLIVYPLLQRDLNKFAQYMGVVADKQPRYNPPLAQQAMAFMAMKNGQPVPQGAVPPGVEQSLRDFARAWTAKNSAGIEPYKHTLYYYLLSNE